MARKTGPGTTCEVDDCEAEVLSRGLCSAHYNRSDIRRAWRQDNQEHLRVYAVEAYKRQNRAYFIERQRERREFIAELKARPCEDCGVEYPSAVMEFDHVRGEKFKAVSMMVSYSTKRILEEVAKCDVVCANCHRLRTIARPSHWHVKAEEQAA